MKEHKGMLCSVSVMFNDSFFNFSGAVTCIKVRQNDQECVSASSDGTCIIWDLV